MFDVVPKYSAVYGGAWFSGRFWNKPCFCKTSLSPFGFPLITLCFSECAHCAGTFGVCFYPFVSPQRVWLCFFTNTRWSARPTECECFLSDFIRRTEAPLPCLRLVRDCSIQSLGFSPLNEGELVLSSMRDRQRGFNLFPSSLENAWLSWITVMIAE